MCGRTVALIVYTTGCWYPKKTEYEGPGGQKSAQVTKVYLGNGDYIWKTDFFLMVQLRTESEVRSSL